MRHHFWVGIRRDQVENVRRLLQLTQKSDPSRDLFFTQLALLQIHFRLDQPQIEQPPGAFVESQRPQAYRRGSNGGDEGERVNERGEERGASDAGK